MSKPKPKKKPAPTAPPKRPKSWVQFLREQGVTK